MNTPELVHGFTALVLFGLGVACIVAGLMQIKYIRRFGDRAGNVEALVLCFIATIVCWLGAALNVWWMWIANQLVGQ